MHLLTHSRARCFADCPRKHHLRYVEGWRVRRESEALRVGSLVHVGLAAYWQDGTILEVVRGRAENPYEQARIDVMLEGYVEKWYSTDTRPNVEILAVEKPFEMPLLNPDETSEEWKEHPGWRLAGKPDAIVRYGDETYAIEHKTTSEPIEDDAADYWSKLLIDHQCSTYVLGAEALGHPVDAVLYDVIRKPAMKPYKATPVEARKYTKAGALYANQREKDETPEEYRARVRAAVFGELDGYYKRKVIPRRAETMRAYMRDAWAQAELIDFAIDAGYAPRNPDACHRFGRCGFWDICSAGVNPADDPDRYERVTNVHAELEEDDDDAGSDQAWD